jgi:hypothetical protein
MPAIVFDGDDAFNTGAISMLDTDEYSWFIVSRSSSQYNTGANAFLLNTNTSFSINTWRAYLYRTNDFICGNQMSGLTDPITVKRALSVFGGVSQIRNPMISNGVLYPDDNMICRTNGGFSGGNSGVNHSGFTHTNTVIGYTGIAADIGFRGQISEILIYSKSINTAEEKIIQNYLGAKYGIVLRPEAAIYGHLATHFNEVSRNWP